MHNAPSVSYPVGRCAFARRFSWGLASLTWLVWLGWLMQQGASALVLVAGGLGLIAGVAAWRSYQAQGGTLTWDGQVWCWHDAPLHDDTLGELQVLLDLQHTLLLRWQPSDKTTSFQTVNLWLSAESAPDFWQDLRRAVLTHNHLG
jgi:toxin CptA